MKLCAILSTAVLSVAAILAGCVSYASYPAVPRNTAINDPNTPAMEEVMIVGLREVIAKYPPRGGSGASPQDEQAQLALNLPRGLKPRVHERIARAVGFGAAPLTPETNHLPIYHVSYLRIRGDQAQINIIRPVTDLGRTPSGMPVMQEIKLQLSGGLRPWHVVTRREWEPGEVTLPELSYYQPEPEAVVEGSRGHDDVYRPRSSPRASPASAHVPDSGSSGSTEP
jgi:hypothetical protein